MLSGLLLLEFPAGGAPVKLDSLKIGSQVYSNVTVFGANATDLFFKHDKGVTNVKLKYLDAELQTRFNYDPKAAAEAEREQANEDLHYQGSLVSNIVAQARKIARAAGPLEESLADPISDKSLLGKPGPVLQVEKWLGEKPELKGKFVLLHFWAPWSIPCLKGIPDLNAFQKRFADRLAVVGLASESEAEIRALTEPKIEFALAIDGQAKLRAAAGVTSLPCVLLLDPKGVVRYQGHPGALNERNLEGILAKTAE